MARYILKRILLLIPLLLGITLMAFALTKALPGDPVTGMVGERASQETVQRIREKLGQDRGAVMQYAGYLTLLSKGELGRSYYTNRSVAGDIRMKLPNTIALALMAMLIAVIPGVIIGFVAAYRRGSVLDRSITALSILGISVPVFWAGLMLMLVLSFMLRLLPPSGSGEFKYIILPALTLSLPAMTGIARVTRTSVSEVIDMPFLQAVRAKGLSPLRIAVVHILRNALIPIVTIIGLDFGSYLNGAVMTETIFGWDGIGRFAMEGIIKRDYPVVMGTIITGTLIFVLVNLAVDIAYHFLDPRVRLDGQQ